MDKQIYDSLLVIVDYLYDDERKDYEANNKPATHIYLDLVRVSAYLDEIAKDFN